MLPSYSFAHGGKDGIPYPVDRKTYDQSIELLRKVINRTKQGEKPVASISVRIPLADF